MQTIKYGIAGLGLLIALGTSLLYVTISNRTTPEADNVYIVAPKDATRAENLQPAANADVLLREDNGGSVTVQ